MTCTAAALKTVPMFFSPNTPTTLRSRLSKPGIWRSALSAARSVGCSHAWLLMPVSVTGLAGDAFFFAAIAIGPFR